MRVSMISRSAGVVTYSVPVFRVGDLHYRFEHRRFFPPGT
jgi:hypothetical protein